jgi:glucose/arabinose dehydrogenase
MRRLAWLGPVLWLGGCGGSPAPAPSTSPPATSGCAAGSPVTGLPALTVSLLVRGLTGPLDIQAPPGDRRLFVAEQGGRIRIVRDGSLQAGAFLDLAGRISTGGERGLLGLAFHPRYGENGRFFVNYTDRSGDTHISEFRASPPSADSADSATERELLFVRQPFANHNGGGLAFGPDGMLYAGLGDGGSGGDPQGNAQNLGTPLGKLLRLDPDTGRAPAGNPFASTPGAVPTIWALGLRNPWRFAFDRQTGDLLVADVGQSALEEIDLLSRSGGDNLGWNTMEGSRCFNPATGCRQDGLTLPIVEYDHSQGCSITGGVFYRGCRLPGYQGTYFYSDYCSAFLRSFRLENGRAVDPREWGTSGLDRVTAFGSDAEGEVYVADQDGEVYRIGPAS